MVERPVECNQCKRPIRVMYKEIVGDLMICTEMCGECPVLEQKLHGQPLSTPAKEGLTGAETGLCCNNCRTTLESIKMGNPLGCSECYEVFADLLLSEISAANALPASVKKAIAAKRAQPLHIGKTPQNPTQIPSSSRLNALNEALNEALKKENYEQAAWLRDQIKDITEKGSS